MSEPSDLLERVDNALSLVRNHGTPQEWVDKVHNDLADLEAEVERLRASFTGKPDQPPLEIIRAKCEQYWNVSVSLCPEEIHGVLSFIHRHTHEAERKLADAERRLGEIASMTVGTGGLWGFQIRIIHRLATGCDD